MKLLALALIAVMAFTASTSFGYERPGRGHGPHHPRPYPGPGHHDDDFSMGLLLGLLTADISSDANAAPEYKMAIVQGEEAALSVLQGAPASDLFANARSAAETLYDVQFDSEEEAALTILKLNQVFSAN